MATYVVTSSPLAHQRVRMPVANNAQLDFDVVELLASLVTNDSAVAGATVRAALETLASSIIAASPWDHVIRTIADLPTPAGGFYDLTSGSWSFAASVALGADAIRVPAGVSVLIDGMGWEHEISRAGSPMRVLGTAHVRNANWLASGPEDGIAVAGGIASFTNCRFEMTGGEAAITTSGTSTLRLLDTDIVTNGSCVKVFGTTGYVNILGGDWSGTGDGFVLSGNETRGFLLHSVVIGAGLTNGVNRSAGTARQGIIAGCRFESTNGVTWAAASMPTMGLSIVGNAFDCATPFNGFTAATARVNAKANTGPAGLLSETAIVP
jgi:hypothetical protein